MMPVFVYDDANKILDFANKSKDQLKPTDDEPKGLEIELVTKRDGVGSLRRDDEPQGLEIDLLTTK
jgi:hypothetical protein